MFPSKRIWHWALLLPALTFFADTMCLWPAPRFLGVLALALVSFPALTVFALLAAAPGSIYFLFTRRPSHSLACLCFIGLWLLAMISGNALRHRAFVRAPQVGARIVQALAQYRDDNGDFPDALEQLPEDIPYTGMIAYPDFTYTKTKPSDYELRIDCTSGGINFDRFIYWPAETYPDRIGGNRVERIGAWAYIHE